MIKLPEQVRTEITLDPKKAPIGKILDVSSVKFSNGTQATYAQFTQHCTEFIDERKLEIKGYQDEITRLKEELVKANNINASRKTSKTLSEGELSIVDRLIKEGVPNTKIAKRFRVSDSTISRRKRYLKTIPKGIPGAMDDYVDGLED